MGTFWTALVWGLGASLGAAVGGMVFVVGLVFLIDWATAKNKAANKELGDNSLNALLRRNELSETMVTHLSRIAEAAEERGRR